MTPSPQLKGSNTTISGVVAIVLGGVGLFSEVWRAIHVGGQLDSTTTMTGLSAILSGIGLVKAADAKQ